MGVMSIRIDDNKKKTLKVIASIEDKTIGNLVSDLIDDYIKKNRPKFELLVYNSDIKSIMKLSEPSFNEWENKEDEIYDAL